ncbi:MAG TPA: hypothetical protein VJM33_10590 [Microthrixaceae bacterium]|nr:hypothetical protein [Microthrixaceae bacterium]
MAAQDGLVDGVPAPELVALLSMPPEEFVTARAARVKELRGEGQREVAAALAKVRKPLRLVWTIGEIARRDPELAAESVDAAEEAGEAMVGQGDVRAAFSQLRDVVARMSEAGRAIDPTVDRAGLELALRQVLSDPTARTSWAEGRLLVLPDEAVSTGDELAPRRARRDANRREARAERSEAPKPTAAEQRARDRARSRLADSQARVDAARTDHDAATVAWREATDRLADAQAEEAKARRAIDTSTKALEGAEHRRAEAQATLDALDAD